MKIKEGYMLILGIDTSFDDTAAAVVDDNGHVHSNVLASDATMFEKWGGVVPKMAREYHQKMIEPVIDRALRRSNVRWSDVAAIAVTYGPGLAISLEVGLAKAKEISKLHNKPLIAANHMEGHLLSFLLKPKVKQNSTSENLKELFNLQFPFIGTLISGGHTEFVLVKNFGEYQVIGSTQDDAMGEAFDKVGRMLGLGFPAGKLLEQMAKLGRQDQVIFPIPMRQIKSCDTSYSGLKTAASKIIAQQSMLDKQKIADIALSFQKAAILHLTEKLEFAIKQYHPKCLVVGGGVVANIEVRKALRAIARKHKLEIAFPYSKKLCTDNAAMIAMAGVINYQRNNFVKEIDSLDRLPNLSL